MLRQLWGAINRDKWKWLAYIIGAILFTKILQGVGNLIAHFLPGTLESVIWLPFLWLPFKIIGLLPSMAIGLFIYWAGRVKIERKNIRPWLFWCGLLALFTALSSICNWVIGIYTPSIIEAIGVVQLAQWRAYIAFGFAFLQLLVMGALFPCMISVWEGLNTWDGYKKGCAYWGKWLSWISALVAVQLITILALPLIVHFFPNALSLPGIRTIMGMSATALSSFHRVTLLLGYGGKLPLVMVISFLTQVILIYSFAIKIAHSQQKE